VADADFGSENFGHGLNALEARRGIL
jgi:hypothetical protein